MEKLKHLFTPAKIGSLELRNRIVMPPMYTSCGGADGSITDILLDYHEARAKGGVGMNIVEASTVNGERKFYPNALGLYDDSLIPGWKKMADRIHKHGSKLATQIMDPGPSSGAMFGGRAVGPSPVWTRDIKETPHELTIEEIHDIIREYAVGIRRAREAGLDAVEIHAAHAYALIGSFLSPIFNKRTDEYGGHLQNRVKLLVDILKAVKKEAGQDFPVIVRISGDDRVLGGRAQQETEFIAPMIAAAGADALEISGGMVPDSFWGVVPPGGLPPAINANIAEAVKKVVDIPVICVGRINSPQLAEFVLASGKADLVSMGRALIADPEMPNKAAAGNFDDIVPCLGDSQACFGHPERGRVSCIMNPSRCREKEAVIEPAKDKKKILVAGGGPAGLEAARVAAVRGHDVSLYEKGTKLGGQINLASVPPFKQEMSLMIKYLSNQVDKLGVQVQLGKEVDSELIDEIKPDAVIVATGAAPLIPENIPGIDQPHVATAWDVLAGKAAVTAKNVVIVGGGAVGCETADFLSEFGDHPLIGTTTVTIVEMLDTPAIDLGMGPSMMLLKRLRDKKVTVLTSTTVKEILNDGLIVTRNGQEEELRGFDQVVLALGASSVETLSEAVKGKVNEVHVIGDAKGPRKALLAMDEGREIGRLI